MNAAVVYIMASVFDYLEWRGDLDFASSPFNETDSLILSVLSYIPFDSMLERVRPNKAPTLKEAANLFFSFDLSKLPVRSVKDTELLKAASETKRFSGIRLFNYVHLADEGEEKQFAAITFLLDNKSFFCSYRGTDLTLVGWKEDFNMCFSSPVPSQLEAVRYLEGTARAVRGRILLGGHSKGGNLAVYAGSFCAPSIQKRIQRIYCNDGPGFAPAVIASKGYRAVRQQVNSFIPESSIIGLLLESEGESTIVKSTQLGPLQHDPFSWEVLGTRFVTVEELSRESRFIDRTVKQWMNQLDPNERERFINAFYQVLTATKAKDLVELTSDWLKNTGTIMHAVATMEESERKLVFEALGLLAKDTGKNIVRSLRKKHDG